MRDTLPSLVKPQAAGSEHSNPPSLGAPGSAHLIFNRGSNPMRVPWRIDGDSMEMRWRFHGDSMEIPWRCHGDAIEIRWRFDGDSMEIPWSCAVGRTQIYRCPRFCMEISSESTLEPYPSSQTLQERSQACSGASKGTQIRAQDLSATHEHS